MIFSKGFGDSPIRIWSNNKEQKDSLGKTERNSYERNDDGQNRRGINFEGRKRRKAEEERRREKLRRIHRNDNLGSNSHCWMYHSLGGTSLLLVLPWEMSEEEIGQKG